VILQGKGGLTAAFTFFFRNSNSPLYGRYLFLRLKGGMTMKKMFWKAIGYVKGASAVIRIIIVVLTAVAGIIGGILGLMKLVDMADCTLIVKKKKKEEETEETIEAA
jgi:hypothetical protein